MNKRTYESLYYRLNNLEKLLNLGKGNPYHDELGRFTFNPTSISHKDSLMTKLGGDIDMYTLENVKDFSKDLIYILDSEVLANLSSENLDKRKKERRQLYNTEEQFELANNWLRSISGSGGDIFKKAKYIGFNPEKEIQFSKKLLGNKKILGFRSQNQSFDKKLGNTSRWSEMPFNYPKDKYNYNTKITKDNILIHPEILYTVNPEYKSEREYVLDNSKIEILKNIM